MNTEDALKWAYESDWGTDWTKDCQAMIRLAEEVQRLKLDIAYLADRASAAGSFGGRMPRDCGTSSNAIVAYAYGGAIPSASYMPCDQSDLAACKLAVERMPEHRKTLEVMEALARAEKSVLGRSH